MLNYFVKYLLNNILKRKNSTSIRCGKEEEDEVPIVPLNLSAMPLPLLNEHD